MNWFDRLECVAWTALGAMAVTMIISFWSLAMVLTFRACSRELRGEGYVQDRKVESACFDAESGQQPAERDCYQR